MEAIQACLFCLRVFDVCFAQNGGRVVVNVGKVMKVMTVAVFALTIGIPAFAQAPIPQQNTTGPVPPPNVGKDILGGAKAVTMFDVPAYIWRHGCAPTVVGMLVGYWDGKPGFSGLISGSATTQTAAVNQVIASGGDLIS